MKTIRAVWSTILAVAVLVAMVMAPLTQASAQDSTIDEIMRRGTLNVGLATFVPWSMRDKEGELIGFEIDVAKRLAEDLDVDVNFIPTAWDGIIPALIAGNFDVIISGMTVTPQRNLTVNFTIPYAHSGMRLVAHQELAADLTKLEDYNDPDVVFSLRRGSPRPASCRRPCRRQR